MTLKETRDGSRPFAIVLATVATLTFWVPTITDPDFATAPSVAAVMVVDVPGAYAPALM